MHATAPPLTTPALTVDLNADAGEGFGVWSLTDDEALLDIITSVNLACGFHAGDPPTMRRLCRLAAERNVMIGAQVSYRDLAGFGRYRIDMPADVLADEVTYQLAALDGFARIAGTRVRYIKPHGALNHATMTDTGQATAVVEAAVRYDPSLALLVQPGSELERQAQRAGLRTVQEAFADRAYNQDGTLVPRGSKDAVLHDVNVIVDRAVTMVREHKVVTVGGQPFHLEPESLCVHGDTPNAVEIARQLRAALQRAGYNVAGFCRP
jgi:5-oxoprolinase (ATP-hydrolysing) subunit A